MSKRHVTTAAGIEAQTSTSGLAQEVHRKADNAKNAADEAAAAARVRLVFFSNTLLDSNFAFSPSHHTRPPSQ